MGNVVVRFTGCKASGTPCQTASAAEGELVSNVLEGELGWENRALKHVANDLFPVGHSGPFLEATCGPLVVKIQGAVLVKVPAGSMLEKATLIYAVNKAPTHFQDNEIFDVLESSFAEGPFEVSGLKLTTVQTNVEKIEVNWFV
jgi:hypothetical protein